MTDNENGAAIDTAKAYSKSERAEAVMGLRPVKPNTIIIDEPCELGYHCPTCKYEIVTDGNFDERLHWSEYNSFLWCEVCNKDYPSALCQPDIDKAIEAFLSTVEDVVTVRLRAAEAETATANERIDRLTEAIRNHLSRPTNVTRRELYVAVGDDVPDDLKHEPKPESYKLARGVLSAPLTGTEKAKEQS
jgi:hypothetical protein